MTALLLQLEFATGIAAAAERDSSQNCNFRRRTQTRDLHADFGIHRVYDFITNYASKNKECFKIIKAQMFATLDKAKPRTQNTRG
jgi:hypothetical protein